MMSADVAQTALKPLDLIDFEKYEDGGAKSYAPPLEGKYTGRAPVITDESFGVTREGNLKLNIDPIEVLDASANGYKVRFTSLSAKKYANRNASQIMDFLRACGVAARPTTNEELKAACKLASNRPFQFQLIWEAYNKDTQVTTSGMDSFEVDPSNPGQRLPYITDDSSFDDQGRAKRWYANGRVRYFISAIQK